jgi:tetratricopeptide (TPR) repeat protein
MTTYTVRLLHLSDLHERGLRETETWRRRRVLGDEWLKNLEKIQEDDPIDLVCFTGDAADWGQVQEFERATELFEATLKALGLSWDRFFTVPGNHDIQRTMEPTAWKRLRPEALALDRLNASRWMAGRDLDRRFTDKQREKLLARQANYRNWLTSIGRANLLPDPALHPHLGYRQTLRLPEHPFDFHVIGLDSAWLCGDDSDSGKLLLTQDQIGRLCTRPDGDSLPGYRLVLVHHPLDDLADAGEARRLLSDRVDLLLRGHLHETEISTWADPDRRLRQIAAGCLYEGHRADQYKNAFEVVEICLDDEGRPLRYDLRFRGWSTNGGFWFDDGGLYRESDGGWLTLKIAGSVPAPEINRQVEKVFVGREAEMEELRTLLLSPTPETRPIAICAIEGMPGVGKSYLADRFALESVKAFPGGAVRLVLDPKNPADAESLLRQLADKLELHGGGPSLAEAARKRLLQPRTLLHVENVDSPTAELEAARFLRQLPGCSALVTGRVRDLGQGAGWKQIPIEAFGEDLALRQLWEEMGRTPSFREEEQEHRELVGALGGLPLAVHLAAGYLKGGRRAPSFLRLLRQRGLDLKPAYSAELAVETSEAARKILSASFEISLDLLIAELPKDRVDSLLDGFKALGHAPLSGFGRSLGAAIAGLAEEDFEELAFQATKLSLLLFEPRPEQLDGTWRFHPMIAELLQRRSDGEAAFDRMTDWFVERLPEAKAGQEEEGGRRWREIHAETAALSSWLTRVPEYLRVLVERAGSTYAQRCGPYRLWISFCEQILAGPIGATERSNTLWTLTQTARSGGLLDRALVVAQEKIALDHSRGNKREATLAWGAVADIFQARGQFDEALRIEQEEVIPTFEELGDVRQRAITLGRIADILQIKGQPDEALRIYQDLTSFFKELGDVRAQVLILGRITDILKAEGQIDEALRIYQKELIPAFERHGDVRSQAIMLGRLASILQTSGQLDEALRIRQQEEIPAYERLESRQDLLIGRANLALIYLERNKDGDREQANSLLCLALYDAEKLRTPDINWIRSILARHGLSCGTQTPSPEEDEPQ